MLLLGGCKFVSLVLFIKCCFLVVMCFCGLCLWGFCGFFVGVFWGVDVVGCLFLFCFFLVLNSHTYMKIIVMLKICINKVLHTT